MPVKCFWQPDEKSDEGQAGAVWSPERRGTATQEEETDSKSEKEDDGPSVFRKRKVAFRFSYDGTKYNGLQRSPVPAGKVTIEDVVFDAMLRTKIVDDIGTAEYIAGGRTDKERFNRKITAKTTIYTTTHGSLSQEESKLAEPAIKHTKYSIKNMQLMFIDII
ncbi:Oidioi.mRNA.OKI2018_I69.PAR.g12175.t1.cds [Oikopleura dioica]|uniref:Oidioi.mRNA.OKI2018_I69.PAR.g12175.t1.cds n=1 Tax=Oikopleura dioica TaxID=34765 RepID=A0ABN7RYX9_OIKDI|nr:Oidioi.mRNA.OKI2018_I69.PAR.g12175.t1.cds [Oikopleura dioica]